MIISQIAAMSENRVIGSSLKLPWHLPEDLKFFMNKTKGHILIYGRKTFESLGNKPLPNRLNIILTRDPKRVKSHPEIKIFTQLEEAIEFSKTKIGEYPEEVFIGGGEEIYKLALPITNRIYLTEIHKTFEGDAFFPDFDKSLFKEIERTKRKEPLPFDFVTYEK